MPKTFEQIEQERRERKEKEEREQAQFEQGRQVRMDEWLRHWSAARPDDPTIAQVDAFASPSDRRRMHKKFQLAALLDLYSHTKIADPKLRKILEDARKYAELDVVASEVMFYNGKYKEEKRLIREITVDLAAYQEKLDQLFLEEPGENADLYESQMIIANLAEYFESVTDSGQGVPKKGTPGVIFVDGVNKNRPSSNLWTIDSERKDDLLFAHEPSSNDIAQRILGDCYFESVLSSIADADSQILRDAMRDNGDGTVDVRFYSRNADDTYTPVIVTVEKVVPTVAGVMDAYTLDSLWVQTFERAFAASGLYQNHSTNPYVKPVPVDVDQLYERYKRKVEEEGYELTDKDAREMPWIVSENRKLHPWKPSYDGIEGGMTAYVIQTIMGPGYSDKGDLTFDAMNLRTCDCINRKTKELEMTTLFRYAVTEYYITAWGDEELDDEEKTAVYQEIRYNDDLMERMLYRCLFLREPPMTEGRINKNDVTVQAAHQIRETLESFLKQQHFKTIDEAFRFTGTGNHHDMTKQIHARFIDLREEFSRNPAYTSPLPGFDPEDTVISMMSGAEFLTELYLDRVYSNSRRHELKTFPDRYTDSQANRLFENICRGRQEHRPICCGTGSSVGAGLAPEHTYSIMGAFTREIHGKTYRFIRVRNPWGQTARKYEQGADGQWKGIADREDKNGYMDLELHDFVNNFTNVSLNGPSRQEKRRNQAPQEPIENREELVQIRNRENNPLLEEAERGNDGNVAVGDRHPRENAGHLTPELAGRYISAFANIKSILRATDGEKKNGSAEYDKLGHHLTEFFEKLQQTSAKEEELKERMDRMAVSAVDYLNHAEDTFRIGSRRSTRVEMASEILVLTDLLRKKNGDPQEVIRNMKSAGQFRRNADNLRRDIIVQETRKELQDRQVRFPLNGSALSKPFLNLMKLMAVEEISRNIRLYSCREVRSALSESSLNKAAEKMAPKAAEVLKRKYGGGPRAGQADRAMQKTKEYLHQAKQSGTVPEELAAELRSIFRNPKKQNAIVHDVNPQKNIPAAELH